MTAVTWRRCRGYTYDMDDRIMTDDPNGTKPTDIIDDGLERVDSGNGLAETVARPSAEDIFARRPSNARGLSDVRSYAKRHPRGAALLVVVFIVVLVALGLAWRRTNNLPALEFIEQDARERIEAPTYSGGYYGNDDRLILTQVTVGARQHSERAPEGADLEETFGATGYATVDVMITFQNESVIATKTANLGYAKQNESWISAGTVNNEQVSFMAISGVNQRKVLHNIDQILERANGVVPADTSRPSLTTLYDGATFEITSSSFDDVAQTDTLTIHGSKSGFFSSYECDIVATFAFRPSNGLWELTDATVTDNAWERRFDLVVGTWQGTFMSQDVSSGTKCLAGSSTPLVITITSWEESGTGARIFGTITGTAHYHRNPAKDSNATEGDTVLAEVPFTATLVEPGNVQLNSEAVFTATLPEAVGGKVSITLQFGTGENGGGVTATVATEHQFEDTFLLIPYQNQVIYADTYDLVKMPDGWKPPEVKTEDKSKTNKQEEASPDGKKSDEKPEEKPEETPGDNPQAAPKQP